jgi:serine/threonine protein kinase
MLRLFNTLEVVNQRPAYSNSASDTQIFYALRYDPPAQHNGAYTILHEEKKENNESDYVEDYDDQSMVSGVSRHSIRSTLTTRSQQNIEDKLRHIRKEKGQQVIAKLTSRSDVVERELKVRKDYHLSRHYVPAIISVHHTVQHAAYSEAMAEPGYCITMEGADTTAENLMLDMRKSGKTFPAKALKRIGISLLHMHEHGIVHGDFGTHNIGKFGSRWKLLGVGGSTPIGGTTDPERGFYHPPESIVIENKRVAIGKKGAVAEVVAIEAKTTYDVWAYGVIVYEAIAGVPLAPYACRGKRAMTSAEECKIGMWDENSVKKALKFVSVEDEIARDLLRRLLHYDPSRRISSMRLVLEHPFFTGGNLPKNHDATEETSPNSVLSSPSRTSRASSNRSASTGGYSLPFREPGGAATVRKAVSRDPPEVHSAMSRESIENRENDSRGRTTRGRTTSPPDSPTNSVRSGRSFSGSFRKLRSSLRRTSSLKRTIP